MVVDDEPLARDTLRGWLEERDEVETIEECDSGGAAVEAIRDRRPDVVFLDVRMPEMDGFEVVERVGFDRMPPTVFVTAHDHYAVRAFEISAVDYVVKPVEDDRLERAFRRACERREASRQKDLLERLHTMLRETGVRSPDDPAEPAERTGEERAMERIAVPEGEGMRLLPVDLVDWIEAAGDYVHLHVGSRSFTVRRRIGDLEERLDPDRFVRIHRSTIVNLDRIERLEPEFHGAWYVILRDDTPLRLSRSRKPALETVLQQRL